MHNQRPVPEGSVPLLTVEGSAYDCGYQLGIVWREVIQARVRANPQARETPWWARRNGVFKRLVELHAPHLPDLMWGLQCGAGMKHLPPLSWPVHAGAFSSSIAPEECTSFSVTPAATLDGGPVSGQTKDPSSPDPAMRYLVLRLQPVGAPAFMTLTYPGDLFGYGFSSTGISAFRNSLKTGTPEKGLPLGVWGLLALCMKSLDQIRELTLQHGLQAAGNILVIDPDGQSMSVESAAGGLTFVPPADDGFQVHTNHVIDPALRPYENADWEGLPCSQHRYRRMSELLAGERGRLTAVKCMQFLADHYGYPGLSICRHPDPDGGAYSRNKYTGAAVVAEPRKGLLHVVRGQPCMNWPTTYALATPNRMKTRKLKQSSIRYV